MLSASEKRFVNYWEEQRKGGKWSYYTLYILAGTIIATIVLYFLLHMMAVKFMGKLWVVPTASFVIITIITVATWSVNEKKLKEIQEREAKENGNQLLK